MKKIISILSVVLILGMLFPLGSCNCIHNFEYTIIKEATCTSEGQSNYMCTKCHEIQFAQNDIVPMKEHEYSTEWTTAIEATCRSVGKKQHICINCGAIDSTSKEIIPMIPHYVSSSGKCITCNSECRSNDKAIVSIPSNCTIRPCYAGVLKTTIGLNDNVVEIYCTLYGSSGSASVVAYLYDKNGALIREGGTTLFVYSHHASDKKKFSLLLPYSSQVESYNLKLDID